MKNLFNSAYLRVQKKTFECEHLSEVELVNKKTSGNEPGTRCERWEVKILALSSLLHISPEYHEEIKTRFASLSYLSRNRQEILLSPLNGTIAWDLFIQVFSWIYSLCGLDFEGNSHRSNITKNERRCRRFCSDQIVERGVYSTYIYTNFSASHWPATICAIETDPSIY